MCQHSRALQHLGMLSPLPACPELQRARDYKALSLVRSNVYRPMSAFMLHLWCPAEHLASLEPIGQRATRGQHRVQHSLGSRAPARNCIASWSHHTLLLSRQHGRSLLSRGRGRRSRHRVHQEPFAHHPGRASSLLPAFHMPQAPMLLPACKAAERLHCQPWQPCHCSMQNQVCKIQH